MTKKVLVISLDAVGAAELPKLQKLPNFSKLFCEGQIYSPVKSLFVSNTYPIHTSIATGVMPKCHGLISNHEIVPSSPDPLWNFDSRKIHSKTLWQAAKEKGLRTATVFWPVTGYAKEIDWNLPESLAPKGTNQMALNMQTGSKLFQISAWLRHHKEMNGISQPGLDNFATSVMYDVLKAGKADLMLLHLVVYDSFAHKHGVYSNETDQALQILDSNLGRLMEQIDSETLVICFSDHFQLNVHTSVNPDSWLDEMGYAHLCADGSLKDYKCFFHSVDGSAFFFSESLSSSQIATIKQNVLQKESVCRLLTDEEMELSGYNGAVFGICPKEGYCFSQDQGKKATHGYPLDHENYEVFYAVSKKGDYRTTGHILDVTGIVADVLSLDMHNTHF